MKCLLKKNKMNGVGQQYLHGKRGNFRWNRRPCRLVVPCCVEPASRPVSISLERWLGTKNPMRLLWHYLPDLSLAGRANRDRLNVFRRKSWDHTREFPHPWIPWPTAYRREVRRISSPKKSTIFSGVLVSFPRVLVRFPRNKELTSLLWPTRVEQQR